MFPCGECGNDMLRRQHPDGTHVGHAPGCVRAVLTKYQSTNAFKVNQYVYIFNSKHWLNLYMFLFRPFSCLVVLGSAIELFHSLLYIAAQHPITSRAGQ